MYLLTIFMSSSEKSLFSSSSYFSLDFFVVVVVAVFVFASEIYTFLIYSG